MLAVIRLFLIAVVIIVISVLGCIYSVFRPFRPNNVYYNSRLYGKIHLLLGIDVEIRNAPAKTYTRPVVYVCNHQNSLDIFTVSNAFQPSTVSIGKKSLKWIPFFGQVYWLSGNILIDRNNTNRALNTIALTVNKIKNKKMSVWLFAEGTRSYGRGILPLKTGAFRTAIQADVPVVPVCTSNTNHIDLNRWDNGKLIIEFLDPIDSQQYKDDVRNFANYTRSLMVEKFEELNKETGHIITCEPEDK